MSDVFVRRMFGDGGCGCTTSSCVGMKKGVCWWQWWGGSIVRIVVGGVHGGSVFVFDDCVDMLRGRM